MSTTNFLHLVIIQRDRETETEREGGNSLD